MDKITLWFIGGFVALVVVIVIVAGVMSGGFSTASPGGAPSGFVATTVPALTVADWTKGNKNAKVTFIEYGDYECPACAATSPVFDQLISAYGDRVLFAFRNFPLYSIHPNAQIAAQAAGAAGLQEKYWEMEDILYQKQNEWASAPPGDAVSKYFDGYARSLGLDVKKFDQDISGSLVADKIRTDVASANAAQVDHTPTFFLNLKQIPNPASYNEFKAVLDQALASSTGS